jgi:hypothetical protein
LHQKSSRKVRDFIRGIQKSLYPGDRRIHLPHLPLSSLRKRADDNKQANFGDDEVIQLSPIVGCHTRPRLLMQASAPERHCFP